MATRIMIQLRFDEDSSRLITTENLMRKLRESFSGVLLSSEDELSTKAELAEHFFRVRGTDGSAVVRSLLKKAERMGPAFRFRFRLDGDTEIRGNLWRGCITFITRGPLIAEGEHSLIDFLESFKSGTIKKSTIE